MRRLVIPFMITLATIASGHADSPSPEFFRDSKNYFAVVPPEGWDREDYPSERVRSKVTFHHPKEKSLSIGVTGGPKPNPSYTLSDYDTEAHEKLPAMQAQAPGTSWAINRRTLGGREFVVVSSKDAGVEFAVLITNVAYYNLSFKYLTRKQYEIYHKDFVHFVESFLPLDTKQFSPSEVRAALADSNRRIAELLVKDGRFQEAMEFVETGLRLDPSSQGMEKLRKQLEEKLR